MRYKRQPVFEKTLFPTQFHMAYKGIFFLIISRLTTNGTKVIALFKYLLALGDQCSIKRSDDLGKSDKIIYKPQEAELKVEHHGKYTIFL